MFFIAMMAAFYLRGHFGYFLLATAFLIVSLFTMIGWWLLRKNFVEVFDRGIAFRRFLALWEDIASIERHPDGSLTLKDYGDNKILLPSSLRDLNELEGYIRRRLPHK